MYESGRPKADYFRGSRGSVKVQFELPNGHQLAKQSDRVDFISNIVPKTHYMSAGEAGRHVVGFLDLFRDVFLEVQNKRYS